MDINSQKTYAVSLFLVTWLLVAGFCAIGPWGSASMGSLHHAAQTEAVSCEQSCLLRGGDAQDVLLVSASESVFQMESLAANYSFGHISADRLFNQDLYDPSSHPFVRLKLYRFTSIYLI